MSRLHRVLKDKTRASALELLGQRGSLSYSELLRLLGIEHTGKLNYHLRVLGDLLDKDEQTGYYTLSEKGKIALALLDKFQREAEKRPDGVLVVGVLLIMAGLYELYVGVPDAASWLSEGSNPFVAFGLSVSIASLALGISFVGSGVGLLYSRRWAWSVTMLSFLVAISLQAIEVGYLTVSVVTHASLSFDEGLRFTSALAYGALPVLVLAGTGLYYMSRPRVRAHFGRGTPAIGKPAVPQLP